MDYREQIARRAALELTDGAVVNLGFGMPTAVANFIPQGVNVILQTENGALNFGPTSKLGEQNSDVANAGGQPISLLPGACIFDSSVSFGIIRGGHVDATILVVNVIITEKAVFHVTPQGLVLKEIAPGLSVEDLQAITEAELAVAQDLCE